MTSISPNYDDYLMHHGVKGMKWGVRKKPEKPTYSSARGLVGDRGYKSEHTSDYENTAKRADYKSQKQAYKASKSRFKSRQNRLMKRSEKNAAKAKEYESYARKSQNLDNRAGSLVRKELGNSKNKIEQWSNDMIRSNNETYYHLKAAGYGKDKILERRVDMYLKTGDVSYESAKRAVKVSDAILRDDYIRRKKK